MALLRSEDQEYETSLSIERGDAKILKNQFWQRYMVTLKSGAYEFTLGSKSASSAAEDECLFCRKPQDEVATMVERLKLLVDFDREKFLFEPAEPSFELSIVRSGITGLKVEIWIDAGNAKTGIYRWDGVGIRFYTQQEHLISFLKELEEEFAW
jgi:hypothetical protein